MLSYEVPGWGVGELYLDGERLLYHELPRPGEARGEAGHELVGRFRDFYGPTMNAFEAARKNGRVAELQRELEALFAAQNASGRADRTTIAATYLRVTVAV